VIIAAGGSGNRMNAPIPKQFIEIEGLPILMHTINAFKNALTDISIIVVLPKEQIEKWENLCTHHQFTVVHEVTNGGETRHQSVSNGLDLIKDRNGIVGVHDGVRPLVSKELIKILYRVAYTKGNAVPAIPVEESIRMVKNNKNNAVDRSAFQIVQTPQCFKVELLKKAFEKPGSKNFTDEAGLVETLGVEIELIPGDKRNIKITTEEDIDRARSYLAMASN